MNLLAELSNLALLFEQELAQACTLAGVEEVETKFLGRKGLLAHIMTRLPELDPQERPLFGKNANAVKEHMQGLALQKTVLVEASVEAEALRKFDPSLPGRAPWQGSIHPLTRSIEEICGVFNRLGFTTVTGPEVETDFYCFEALNFPHDHPARDMQDTLYVSEGIVMRTHTSPMQVRTMVEVKKPPVAVVVPGKVYRRDSDLTHTPMFHQVEGLLVDTNINLTHLRGTLTAFVYELFGSSVKTRFRPSFFPFTEPSIEVDISCILCNGKGHNGTQPCRVCKATGWLEILGCGMIDPEVFTASGFDRECTGFAFGLGVERVTMLKYGITDLRMFFENDLRFLSQFA